MDATDLDRWIFLLCDLRKWKEIKSNSNFLSHLLEKQNLPLSLQAELLSVPQRVIAGCEITKGLKQIQVNTC